MFRNHLKIAWRNALKNRMYSIIIVVGLTLGLWACMSVITVVMDDLSYDTQWSKSDRIYRINTKADLLGGEHNKIPQTWVGMSDALKQNFPEVEDVSSIHQADLDLKLRETASEVIQVSSLETDTSIWNVLDLSVLSGTPKHFVEGHANLVVSESFRKKYFPDENPVGHSIFQIPRYGSEPTEYLITGIIKDLPANTHLRANVILVKNQRTEPLYKKQYGTFAYYYMVLKPGIQIDQFTTKVNEWYADYVEVEDPFTFEFQPVKDIYLHSEFAQGQKIQGNYSSIFVLSGISLLLLLIACINFVNLTTARTVQRMKEIGVRKILGAGKRTVAAQFLTESALFFILSTMLGLLLYYATLPYIENFIEHKLAQKFLSGYSAFIWILLAIIPISLLSGIYPAFAISRLKPVSSITGVLHADKGINRNYLQKSLVVFQFSISIMVLIALIIVQQQEHYLNNKDIGYNKDNLLAIDFVSWDDKGATFKNELLKRPDVTNATITNWVPSQGPGFMYKRIDDPNNEEHKIDLWFIKGDVDLPATLGLKLKKGRLFDDSYESDKMPWKNPSFTEDGKQIPSESIRSSLVTEYTASVFQINSLNHEIKGTETSPVGIVADFNSESLKNPLKPTLIISEDSPKYGGMLIRVNSGNKKNKVTAIHNLWEEFYPDKVLDIKWVDQMLNQQYKAESKLRQLFYFFSLLTMFLASLGILGLVEHAVARRVKEVGIRKVLGASVNSIILLFSKNYIKLLVVAALIASPIAWYGANRWLQNFAYRIDIEWWVFAMAGMLTIIIAIATLTFQTIKAAMANPVESLRTE